MTQHTPTVIPSRTSNDLERSFYELFYAVQNVGRSTKGRYDMTDPARALLDAKTVRQQLLKLERVCRADIRKRNKYAIANDFPIPFPAHLPKKTEVSVSAQAEIEQIETVAATTAQTKPSLRRVI